MSCEVIFYKSLPGPQGHIYAAPPKPSIPLVDSWEKAHSLLQKNPFSAVDFNTIIDFEISIPIATRRHIELVITMLHLRAQKEKNPTYYDYCFQAAAHLEGGYREAWEKKILGYKASLAH